MDYPRLAARLYNTPLLLTPEKAEIIEGVFRAHVDGRAEASLTKIAREEMAVPTGLRRMDGGYYLSQGGIALVPVMGTLLQRSGGLDAMSGLTGYNRLTQQLAAAFAESQVRGVMLEIDSHGGEVAGAFEFADLIANAPKPVWAHANELAASAGYLIASAAGKLFLPATGMVGSVGVVMLHMDRSRQLEKQGVTYTPIFAGARKVDGASFAPLSDSARADAQARVEYIYDMFVDAVATRRKIDAFVVRNTEAGMLSAQDAKSSGFADDVITLEQALQAMAADVSSPGLFPRAPRASLKGAILMAQNEVQQLAAAQSNAAATTEQLAAARAEGVAEGRASIAQELATDRQRVLAIIEHAEAQGRESMARHLALKMGMSAEDAIALLAAAPKGVAAVADPLAAAMPANPKVGADIGDTSGMAPVRIDTAAIYNMRRVAAQNTSR